MTLRDVLHELRDAELSGPCRIHATADAWLEKLTAEELDQEAVLLPAQPASGWPRRVRVVGTSACGGSIYSQPALLRRGDSGILFTVCEAREGRTEPPPGAAVSGWMVAEEPRTRCKHGRGDCDECGTSDRRDALHTTEGGVGVVGRALRGGR